MHKKIHTRLLAGEVILISASIIIFRSGWHLLDKYDFFNETPVLWVSLFFGFAVAIPTWRYVMEQQDKHHS